MSLHPVAETRPVSPLIPPRVDMTVGLGLKAPHYADALACSAAGLWFEVHAENYMVDGGPRLAWLDAIRRDKPLSIHGVGLSLAGDVPPDPDHLDRLCDLALRFEPALVSEHLAWSRHGQVYHPDLLPFLRTRARLERIAENIGRVQDALGRAILIENPSLYLALRGHELDEVAFLTELIARTGCGLLLDVNNVHVTTHNLGGDPRAYIDALPAAAVAEIHVAGHAPDERLGEALLIDSHDAPVSDAVWALYDHALARFGPCPTLIERDGNVPVFAELMAERDRALGHYGAQRGDRHV